MRKALDAFQYPDGSYRLCYLFVVITLGALAVESGFSTLTGLIVSATNENRITFTVALAFQYPDGSYRLCYQ